MLRFMIQEEKIGAGAAFKRRVVRTIGWRKMCMMADTALSGEVVFSKLKPGVAMSPECY